MNEEQTRECKETFELYDIDMKGYLSLEQAKDIINSFGIMVTEEEVKSISSDGKVNYDSFLTFYSDKMKAPKNDNLEESFKNLLSKKTGKISAKTFKMYLMNFGMKFSEKEADEVIAEFKVDNEGNLNYIDFIKAMDSQ